MKTASGCLKIVGPWLCVVLCAGAPLERRQAPATQGAFTWVDVFVDAGEVPLAAWQVALSAAPGRARIVGIEGGDHAAFHEPGHYDPTAIRGEKVIVAAFSTAAELPVGRTRVMTVHLQRLVEGDLGLRCELQAAGDSEGQRIGARVSWEVGR